MPYQYQNKTWSYRVGGSKFTYFQWEKKPLVFARQIAHTSPAPVGPGPVAIQPLDEYRPVQIITPAAIGMGTITIELYETYDRKIWDQFMEYLTSKNPGGKVIISDLADIFQFMADIGEGISLDKYVAPPKGSAQGQSYTESYNNCVITNAVDGETIEIGTMEILKQITVAYTHVTYANHQSDRKNYKADPSAAGWKKGP